MKIGKINLSEKENRALEEALIGAVLESLARNMLITENQKDQALASLEKKGR